MKQALSAVSQVILLGLAALAGFITGMTVPSLRVYRVVSHTTTNLRTYDFDWLIAVFIVYALLLLGAALRKRLRTGVVTSTIALVVVVAVVALFTQLGIKDTPVNGY